MKRNFIALTLVVLLCCFGLLFAARYTLNHPGPLLKEKIIYISPGTPLRNIAQTLSQEDVISSPWIFCLYTIFKGESSNLKAGDYKFHSGISLQQVIQKLIMGDLVTYSITVPEGAQSQDVLKIMRKSPALISPLTRPLQDGALWPSTYHVRNRTSYDVMVTRMEVTAQKNHKILWQGRAPELSPFTFQQALILASIVQKEAGSLSEMPLVASVFLNRLKKGIPLQADPTVQYAIEKDKGPLKRSLLRKDLLYPSPYNTYQNSGLPPGPICNPGKAAIQSVLHPQSSPFYYFVANGTGGHTFAKTYAEHLRNVKVWQQRRK